MNRPYIHLLVDPAPLTEQGQLICDECKLSGREDLEPWENFLNGHWTSEAPDRAGLFPVIISFRNKQEPMFALARQAKNNKKQFIWPFPSTCRMA